MEIVICRLTLDMVNFTDHVCNALSIYIYTYVMYYGIGIFIGNIWAKSLGLAVRVNPSSFRRSKDGMFPKNHEGILPHEDLFT